MKELVSHIEFLLLQHECVIIPHIGGFVLNKEHAFALESGVIVAPAVSVGFNADLRFNDGLLAESYMQKYDIPYDAAMKKIDDAVGQIRSELITRHEMTFGKMGVLKLNDGRIIYEPSLQHFVHPSVWGCSDLTVKRLCDLLTPTQEVHIGGRWRRVVIGVASTAAAIALWVMMPSIGDGMFQTIQRSGFFVQNTRQAADRIEYKPIVTTERDAFLDEYAKNITEQAAAVISPAVVQPAKETLREAKPVLTRVKRYYIIIGGDTDKNRANRMLSGFKAEGMKNAGIVDSSDRRRIYAAVFRDKTEAEKYLNYFRRKYPAHGDAWLFTKATMEKTFR